MVMRAFARIPPMVDGAVVARTIMILLIQVYLLFIQKVENQVEPDPDADTTLCHHVSRQTGDCQLTLKWVPSTATLDRISYTSGQISI